MENVVLAPSAMHARTLIAIALVGMVIVGGTATVAATPPTNTSNASVHSGDHPGVNASDPGPEQADRVGPSDELPEEAPDHVSGIHDRIQAFFDGTIDHLGNALSGFLGSQ